MIAVDTSALLWAVKGATSPKLTYTAQLDAIKKMGGPVLLPAPALAEYLVKFSGSQRNEVLALVADSMHVAPFDLRAVAFAADLFKKGPTRSRKVSRQEFKVDAMILAIALANGARTLLCEDGDFENLASGGNITLVSPSKVRAQTLLAPV